MFLPGSPAREVRCVVKMSGFTIVRNAVKLDYPVVASIRSLLPICDEVVVNVGRSDDDTLSLIRSIRDPRVRIIETDWDMRIGDKVLGDETLAAMRACQHPWGVYIQADEVLHETGAEALARAIQQYDGEPMVEGLLVKYRHFYGNLDTVAMNRRWYRREVRAVRLNPALEIRPYQGAQGFRVGPGHRKIRARLTDAEMFHYGWAQSRQALRSKREVSRVLYPWAKQPAAEEPMLPWFPGLKKFGGTHPAAAHEWIESRRDDPERVIEPKRFRWQFLRYYISGAIERLTGARIFEFRNYEIV
jgi:hypothetical protein